ncbi:unnamed protein product [Zymoseptoria tritici ST99CH_1E4]|uniref:Uncharacterized protein n=1 Tax=Zymoseptoria tritici ST99CH_1E4 TaxID=1276532 RepID=A0A2H1GNV7_ZYMTR|nr:unnamed protein product [Zymoseptoria tritici ST99CH_1E4]
MQEKAQLLRDNDMIEPALVHTERTVSGGLKTRRKDLTIVLLLASNLLSFMLLLLPRLWSHLPPTTPDPTSTSNASNMFSPAPTIALVSELPTHPVQFHWSTAYSSPDDSEADDLWNAIDTAHGYIAVEHEWARERGWMASMPVPGDETKALYVLEGYHQFHCLKIVRTVFLQSIAGKELSYPVQHARHCFDYFRQFIQCHADPTPLYTLGRHTSGDGQWHMCKDWNALRDYATENSACFRDRVGNESLREQFGNCEGRENDGVIA